MNPEDPRSLSLSKGALRQAQGTDRQAQGTDRQAQGTDRQGQGTDRQGQGTDRQGQGTDRQGQGTDRQGQGTDRQAQGTDRQAQGTDRQGQRAVGTVVLAGTPIGDAADASPRLRTELAGADVIAAEDTRRFRRLLDRLEVTTSARVVSYFEGNEAARTPELLTALAGGARVVLVTDAGMPSVSDPGYRLVVAAVAAGYAVTAVPGPSAVLTALAVSGLPVDRFCFEGFLPRKAGERARRLGELRAEPRTLVFFEAPHRTAEALAALAEAFGADRRGAVCRELTKTYEEVVRGPLSELVAWAQAEVRGEVTLVVAGAARPVVDLDQATARVHELVRDGARLKPAVAEVAAETGLAKNALYELALKSDPSTPLSGS